MRESLTRASILTFLSSNLVFLVGLAVSVLIARALGPAGKGIYAVFLNTSGLLVVPAAAVETSLLYIIAQHRPDKKALNRFVWRAAVVQGIVMVGLLAGLIRISRVRHFLFPGLPEAALLV